VKIRLERLRLLSDLSKFSLSLSVALSAAAGFIIAGRGPFGEIAGPTLGTFFLACGSSSLNQYQERTADGRMERTKRRPLPSGKMEPGLALSISLGLMAVGLFVLFFNAGALEGVLGLVAVLLYNGIYTFLKPKTLLAVIPGALVGTIPPLIGWVSRGGGLLDPEIRALCLFFFLWQVPHCWLLLLSFAGDYEKAGFSTPSSFWVPDHVRGIISIWMLSAAVCSLLLTRFFPVRSSVILLLLFAMSLWFSWNATHFFRSQTGRVSLKFTFMRLNVYVLSVVCLLSADRLWPGVV
jgi:protoheme IX farnesyltransferase